MDPAVTATDSVTSKIIARAAERNRKSKFTPLNEEDFVSAAQTPLLEKIKGSASVSSVKEMSKKLEVPCQAESSFNRVPLNKAADSFLGNSNSKLESSVPTKTQLGKINSEYAIKVTNEEMIPTNSISLSINKSQ